MRYHIFSNDLRYQDNDALGGWEFVPIFHLNPEQYKSKHASPRAVRFMLECLISLPNMNVFEGSLSEFKEMLSNLKASDITMHKDYTLYALKRERKLKGLVRLIETDRFSCDPSELQKKDGAAYVSFGGFYSNLKTKEVREPRRYSPKPMAVRSRSFMTLAQLEELKDSFPENDIPGGRRFNKRRVELFESRDNISSESMKLSPYLAFGCYSIREMYKLGSEAFKKQLAWRQFYQMILKNNPRAREYTCLDPRYNKFPWRFNRGEWDDLVKCRTGVLVVDAAMAELLATGFMNNRCRLLWMTYLVKYLQIDPYEFKFGGISMFSRHLIDCCTSQNKLNAEWVISSLDLSGKRYAPKGNPMAGRPMRIDNKTAVFKYGAGDYIRKWLPSYRHHSDAELAKVESSLDLDKMYSRWTSETKKLNN